MAANHKNGSKNGTKAEVSLEKPYKELLTDISLRTGNWRELFTEQACMLIIADALNDCVVNGVFSLAGYLVTGRRVFLAVYQKGADTDHMLFLFYESVRRAVRHFIDAEKQTGQQTGWQLNNVLVDEMLIQPFQRQYSLNDYLEKLVTGRRVYLPYQSLYLDKLKVVVRQAAFCSAIQYQGGEGPVIIEKLRKTIH